MSADATTGDLGRALSLARVALLVAPLLGAVAVGGIYAARLSAALEAIQPLSAAVADLRHAHTELRADVRSLAGILPSVDLVRIDLADLRARVIAVETRLERLEDRTLPRRQR